MANLINLCFIFACLASIQFCHCFTIDLIHVDSPHSPFYNPHLTPSQRFQKNIKHPRTYPISSSPIMHNLAAESDVTADNNGYYLMKFSIGSPLRELYGQLHTGSDLIWTKCSPCNCSTDRPIFEPAASSTYKDIACGDQACNLPEVNCSTISKLCNYTYGYIDGQYSSGVLAKETITIASSSGKTLSVNDITIGCAHGVHDRFDAVVGLSLGTASFINQIGTTFGAKMFSHCLVPFHNAVTPGKMILGSEATVSGPGTIKIPLVKNYPGYYSVTLNGISVNGNLIPYSNSSGEAQKGNMIIDSAATRPALPLDFYNRLTDEIKKSISWVPFIDDEKQLCYKSYNDNFAPTVTLHFDGADLELNSINIFVQQNYDQQLFCYAITHTSRTNGVYGNLFQYDYWMGFDADNMMLSIKLTNCSQLS